MVSDGFHQFLRRALEARQMNQRQFLAKLGWSEPWQEVRLSQYLNGHRQPSIATVREMTQVLPELLSWLATKG